MYLSQTPLFKLTTFFEGSLHLYLYGEIHGRSADDALRELVKRRKSLLRLDDPGFAGHYLLFVFDADSKRLRVWRDVLGLIPLFYACAKGQLVLGTSPWDVARAAGFRPAPDHAFLAVQLSLCGFITRHSPLRDVQSLLPGHWLVQDGENRLRTVAADPIIRFAAPKPSAPDLAHWKSAVTNAVLRQTPSEKHRPIAVMLSGGLDSASIVAALRAAQPERPIRGVAWSLTAFAQSDESSRTRQSAEALGIPLDLVEGSGNWPGRNLAALVEEHWPLSNPYWPVMGPVLQRAADRSCERIFNGHGGDDLFAAHRYRLVDALRARNAAAAFAHAVRAFSDSWPRPWRAPALRELGRSLLNRRSAQPRPDWLTDEAQHRIDACTLPFAEAPRPQHWRACLAQGPVPGFWLEAMFARRYGLQRRHPLQDPDLIRLALALPAHRLLDEHGSKALELAALRDWAPHHTWPPQRSGLLDTFFAHGIFDRERHRVVEILFGQDDPLWAQIVQRPFIESVLKAPHNHRSSAWLVLWMCCCVEIWAERLRQSA